MVHRQPETAAVIACLAAAGIVTGDAERPVGAGFEVPSDTTSTFTPYVVVHTGIVSGIDGPVSDPYADTVAEYQLTCIGVTADQARVVSDLAKDAMLAQSLSITGRHLQLVEWTTGRPTERDDSVTPPLFYAIDIYSVSTSPA